MEKIELTKRDAEMFIEFQKHYALIGLLNSIKAFDIKGGSVTIHFGSMGEIKTVDKHEYYRV
jgi:hypothetical protein